MLSWFNKRRLREQKKLCWQNIIAAEAGGFLSQRYSENPDVNEEFDLIRGRAERALAQLVEGSLLQGDPVSQLLNDNMALRNFHDRIPKDFRLPFDEFYAPSVGWREFLAR